MFGASGSIDRAVNAKTQDLVNAKTLGFPFSRRSFALKGQLPKAPRLAVVGSRAALTRDRPGVQRLVELAKQAGWSLVSGGALGVDGWMHQAALEQGAPQLAVLPCAWGESYPPAHAELFAQIAQAGHSGLLYALASGRAPARHVFIARNELVVRGCDALVVVQSRPRSGSLWTGKRALALKRPTAVFSGTVGSDRLIAAGAVDLGAAQGSSFDARVRAFLVGRPLSSSRAWPAHLRHLQRLFDAHPGEALGIEDCSEPLYAAAQLAEAAALGLITEFRPGAYKVIS